MSRHMLSGIFCYKDLILLLKKKDTNAIKIIFVVIHNIISSSAGCSAS